MPGAKVAKPKSGGLEKAVLTRIVRWLDTQTGLKLSNKHEAADGSVSYRMWGQVKVSDFADLCAANRLKTTRALTWYDSKRGRGAECAADLEMGRHLGMGISVVVTVRVLYTGTITLTLSLSGLEEA